MRSAASAPARAPAQVMHARSSINPAMPRMLASNSWRGARRTMAASSTLASSQACTTSKAPLTSGAAPATIRGTLAALASAINHRDCSRGGFCKLADGSCSRVLAPPLTRRYGWRAGHANALHAARTTLH
ncbi:hypothetical protein G6F24_016946 [Rhizopus arrhizus]|nr:hypothetical protein G6F24_016946 [Rhizopus arrhizus]